VRSFLNKDADCVAVAETVARRDRVGFMELYFIVVIQRGRDSTLRILRGGFFPIALGDDENRTGLGELDGGAKTGHTRSDYKKVRFQSRWVWIQVHMVQRKVMATFSVRTPAHQYDCVVARGCVAQLADRIPDKSGNVFVVTTEDVWDLHGRKIEQSLGSRSFHALFFPGGEERKRMVEVEILAEQMVELGADRSSIVVSFGGGIVGDLAGFLAAIFMRGISVIQVPTTLLAQVDAAIGGKTGANLVSGKNLIGAFHQPLAVLIDPDLLTTLTPREYRAGLYEVVKCGIIRSPRLFGIMHNQPHQVLARDPATVEEIVAQSVRIKAEVVTADEKESGLRRILNFGHTLGHALEAETRYAHLLHGEAVAFGMRAATHLGWSLGTCPEPDARAILESIGAYGKIPPLTHIRAENLVARLGSDKKTIQGKVHFVLPKHIGETEIRSGIDGAAILAATGQALAELA